MDAHDRLALHELPGRYGDLIDDKDWEGLAAIFTDGATFSINGRPLASLAEIRHYMAYEANHPLAHLMTNVYVDEIDGAIVLSSRIVAMRPDGTIKSGRYRDVVVKGDQGWRVTERVFVSTPPPAPE